jgi:hypothetical protein
MPISILPAPSLMFPELQLANKVGGVILVAAIKGLILRVFFKKQNILRFSFDS